MTVRVGTEVALDVCVASEVALVEDLDSEEHPVESKVDISTDIVKNKQISLECLMVTPYVYNNTFIKTSQFFPKNRKFRFAEAKRNQTNSFTVTFYYAS